MTDINRPWLSLDPWQLEYIATPAALNNFLLCGRQVGKTTAMSIKAVELCVNQFNKGEYVLICSITEKQAYHMLAKALVYANEMYPNMIMKGKDKPTMHRITFKNGTGIHCYASGDTGEGLRGYTIKKLMIDEGSRMSDEFFIAVSPMLSVVNGSMDIASTPCGKVGFFYKCSLDDRFKKFYVSAEDCPRHSKEFLLQEQERLSKLAYAQEYKAMFTDELRRLFNSDLINKICVLSTSANKQGNLYMGVDIAAMGQDQCAYAVLERINNMINQLAIFVDYRQLTIQTSAKIFEINNMFPCRLIGVDDAGVGFGVFSELLADDRTKRKVRALNNNSRPLDKDGEKSKQLLKEDMYFNLLSLMEHERIKLLNNDEVKASLASIQFEVVEKEGEKQKTKIWGNDDHIAEAINRAAWLAEKEKGLNIFAHTF